MPHLIERTRQEWQIGCFYTSAETDLTRVAIAISYSEMRVSNLLRKQFRKKIIARSGFLALLLIHESCIEVRKL